MSTSPAPEDASENLSREEIMAALFANMVIQQGNMALTFLGKLPHPESGEVIKDPETAKFFIDQLEMIEFKTKGNLDKREEGLLKQTLMTLRMAFVEAVESGSSSEAKPPAQAEAKESSSIAGPTAPAPGHDDESRKKFTKKY